MNTRCQPALDKAMGGISARRPAVSSSARAFSARWASGSARMKSACRSVSAEAIRRHLRRP
jgi:hypothetical protein